MHLHRRVHIPSFSPVIEQVVFKAQAKAPLQRCATVLDFATTLVHAALSSQSGLHSALTALRDAKPGRTVYTGENIYNQVLYKIFAILHKISSIDRIFREK